MCFMCSVRVHALYVCLPLSPQKKAGPLSLTEEAREKFESREEVLANPSVSKTVVDIRQKVLQVLHVVALRIACTVLVKLHACICNVCMCLLKCCLLFDLVLRQSVAASTQAKT